MFDQQYEQMQTAEARAGMQAAFDASPEQLGEAAVAKAALEFETIPLALIEELNDREAFAREGAELDGEPRKVVRIDADFKPDSEVAAGIDLIIVNDEAAPGEPLAHCGAVTATPHGLEATVTLAPGSRVVPIEDWRRERRERKAAAKANSAKRYLGGPAYDPAAKGPRGEGPGAA